MLKADNPITVRQYWVAIGFTILVIFLLLSRYFFLQIVNNNKYKTKADNNRIRTITLPAPRGLILDRNGQIIVDNYPTYVLTATPGEMTDRPKEIGILANLVQIDSSVLSYNYQKYRRGQFTKARLARDLSFDQISKLEENKRLLPGVSYSQYPERFYPGNVNASHLLGYVKEVDKSIIPTLNQSEKYRVGDLVGWAGLEKQYELLLKGESGIRYMEVDAHGREIGDVETLSKTNPEPGQNIFLSLDLPLQQFIEDIMTNKKGAIIVTNPNSGEILAAASAPDYNPDLFSGIISPSEWDKVRTDKNNPLLNRLVQGLYQPGSIIKMISAFAIMDNSEFDPNTKFHCYGQYQFGDRLFGCWLDTGHGEIDLKEAIIQSCDVYFYKTIQHVDIDDLAYWFSHFGFGQKTNLDFPIESKGIVPTKSYFHEKYGRYGWSKGAILNLGIGQGELLVTPVQVSKYINTLASFGQSTNLSLLKKKNSHLIERQETNLNNKWDYIISSMFGVVNGEHGTGKSASVKNKNVKVYGKTGSAENPHGATHAWFVGFASDTVKTRALTILLENAGSGGAVAAPVAGKIFNYLFN